MRTSLLALGLLIPLVACDPRGPVVGGPCSYDSTVFDVTVKAVDDAGITFDGPDGEFRMSLSELETTPAVGETLTVKRDLITEGTCTPEIYSIME
ncbi:hypothetical protein [Hyphomonas pacifica]|uniref:hypothetical protein n=1 Tax=Hyphomonas pacifica TaxID=1280941 RepID=UPI000DBFD5F8|nr:hypothetical protein [Hyphomonas pacifica]RAN35931.1 hypothetical protein HY11_13190 [Hyphomonas pacifica]